MMDKCPPDTREISWLCLSLPLVLEFLSIPMANTWINSEAEVTLPHHLRGMKFLTCLEWFVHIQAKRWQGHQPVSLGPFPLHYTSTSHTLLSSFYPIALRLFTNSATSGLRVYLFWLWKINSHYRRERKGEHMLKREGDGLLSLSVWPCLTAVISLNCFANIIPTQPGSRSARPLCWSWLEAFLLHDLSSLLPFCFFLPPLGSFWLEYKHTVGIQPSCVGSCPKMTWVWINPIRNSFFSLTADNHLCTLLYSWMGNRLPELTFIFPSGDAGSSYSASYQREHY